MVEAYRLTTEEKCVKEEMGYWVRGGERHGEEARGSVDGLKDALLRQRMVTARDAQDDQTAQILNNISSHNR